MIAEQRSSIVSLTALQQVVVGLKCYKCDQCNDVDSSTTTTDVASDAGYSCRVSSDTFHASGIRLHCCFHMIQKMITLAAGTVIATVRDATTKCSASDGVSGGTGVRITCCTTDKCNSSSTLSSSLGLSLAFIIIGSIIRGTMAPWISGPTNVE